VFQKPLKLVILRSDQQVQSPVQQTEQAIHSDPKIKSLQETFQATIVPGSIKPLVGTAD